MNAVHSIDISSKRTSTTATYHRGSTRHNFRNEQPRATVAAADVAETFEQLLLMDMDRMQAWNPFNRHLELAYEQDSYLS